jgi:hypothetical protein
VIDTSGAVDGIIHYQLLYRGGYYVASYLCADAGGEDRVDGTFFDCAATSSLYQPQIFEHLADIVGVEKILFGTDYPLMLQRRVIDQIESTRLS